MMMLAPERGELADTSQAVPAPFKPDLPKYRRWLAAYESNKQVEIDERQIARRYYNSKQWTADEITKLQKRGQAPIFDNRIARKIDFIVGIEQRQRRDPKGYPRGPGDEQSANVATAGMRYVCDLNRWASIASECTYDGIIDAVGVVCLVIEQRRNGPEPVLKHVQSDRFFYDPRSVRHDFSDSRYNGLHLWMDIDEAKEKWPDKAMVLQSMVDRSTGLSGSVRIDQNYATAWADFEGRRVRVIEIWEKTAQGWYYCFFTGDEELECGVSPYLDEDDQPDNPYVAWSPYIDETGNRYGMVRAMRPLQDEINHRRSKFLHLLSSKQLYIRKGTIDDIDELRKQVARPDGIIEHDGDWGKETGIVDHAQDISGQAELLAQSQSSLENLGPNPGLIGRGGGVADQSGVAIKTQRDSGMIELSPIFDRNRDWKLRVYRKTWSRIKQAWTGEKWIRVTEDKNAPQFLGINQYGVDPNTGQLQSNNVLAAMDIDIIMDEGPDTVTMNEELLQVLSGMAANPAVPPKVLIELSNAPNKEALFKLIDQAGAADPAIVEMQKRMAKLEELMAAANVDKAQADVENKRADTLSKLLTIATPPQQQSDEFGRPMGPPPAQPDLMGAFEAMNLFPLQYGQPTLEQMAFMMPEPAPADQQGMNGQAPPEQPGLNPQPPPGLPPEAMMVPGELPVDPQYATL